MAWQEYDDSEDNFCELQGVLMTDGVGCNIISLIPKPPLYLVARRRRPGNETKNLLHPGPRYCEIPDP